MIECALYCPMHICCTNKVWSDLMPTWWITSPLTRWITSLLTRWITSPLTCWITSPLVIAVCRPRRTGRRSSTSTRLPDIALSLLSSPRSAREDLDLSTRFLCWIIFAWMQVENIEKPENCHFLNFFLCNFYLILKHFICFVTKNPELQANAWKLAPMYLFFCKIF